MNGFYILTLLLEYYSAIKKNTFESVLMRWMKLEPIIQSEVSQKEKHQYSISSVQFSSVQLLSRVQLFATQWIAACQASLSITNCWSPPKPTSIELVMPSNHLILCRPLLLPPTIFPSIRIISSDSVLHNQVTKILEFQLQHQSFQGIFRTDFL